VSAIGERAGVHVAPRLAMRTDNRFELAKDAVQHVVIVVAERVPCDVMRKRLGRCAGTRRRVGDENRDDRLRPGKSRVGSFRIAAFFARYDIEAWPPRSIHCAKSSACASSSVEAPRRITPWVRAMRSMSDQSSDSFMFRRKATGLPAAIPAV